MDIQKGLENDLIYQQFQLVINNFKLICSKPL